jgi:hypothetical protein
MKRLGAGLNILLIVAAAVRRRIHLAVFVGRIDLTSATALFKRALGNQAKDAFLQNWASQVPRPESIFPLRGFVFISFMRTQGV